MEFHYVNISLFFKPDYFPQALHTDTLINLAIIANQVWRIEFFKQSV